MERLYLHTDPGTTSGSPSPVREGRCGDGEDESRCFSLNIAKGNAFKVEVSLSCLNVTASSDNTQYFNKKVSKGSLGPCHRRRGETENC